MIRVLARHYHTTYRVDRAYLHTDLPVTMLNFLREVLITGLPSPAFEETRMDSGNYYENENIVRVGHAYPTKVINHRIAMLPLYARPGEEQYSIGEREYFTTNLNIRGGIVLSEDIQRQNPDFPHMVMPGFEIVRLSDQDIFSATLIGRYGLPIEHARFDSIYGAAISPANFYSVSVNQNPEAVLLNHADIISFSEGEGIDILLNTRGLAIGTEFRFPGDSQIYVIGEPNYNVMYFATHRHDIRNLFQISTQLALGYLSEIENILLA